MKKNKITKRTVKKKNNYFKYVAMVLLVVFATVGVSQILGFEINKDTRVCMDKKGNLFVPLDKDGNVDECKKHADAVTFNFDGGSGSVIGGGVAFMYIKNNSEPLVLKEDGKVLKFKIDTGEWEPDDLSETIDDDLLSNISQWYGDILITNDGKVYMYNNIDAWVEKPFSTSTQ